MEQSTTERHFSPRASLAALGAYLQHIQLLAPIRDRVHIPQRTVKHTPTDKLYDALIAILAGAHGLVEVNTRLRSDPALQRAFGRTTCADQSTIQATLNACSASEVAQLHAALTTIYQTHSQGYQHDYAARPQLLDIDLSGVPCGKTAERATRGYFAKQRNRRGRQLGRVFATRYDEIVSECLAEGKTNLPLLLQALVLAAEQVLELDDGRRARTIVRVDSGGGSLDDVRWLVGRGYWVHTKIYTRQQARRLSRLVTTWWPDPQIADREVGWVPGPTPEYGAEVQRIAVRWRKPDGAPEHAVVLSSVPALVVLEEVGRAAKQASDPQALALAYVRLYDQRGGGVETSLKEDKQGLGLTKRNKKRFAAQEMVVLLGQLAHNVLVWARRWLAQEGVALARYGVQRLVRDVLSISGCLAWEGTPARLITLVLNERAPLARLLALGLARLLQPTHITVSWGQI